MCEETFEDDWGNTWYEGKMMLEGVWYYRVVGQRGETPHIGYWKMWLQHLFTPIMWWHQSFLCSQLLKEWAILGFSWQLKIGCDC